MASSATPNDDEIDEQFEQISKQLGDLANVEIPDAASPPGSAAPPANPLAALFGGAPAGGASPFGQLPTPLPPSRVAADIIKAQANAAEPNVDPVHRAALDRITRVAELHVTTITGLDPTSSGAPARLTAVKRSEWLDDVLASCAALIDLIAQHAATPDGPDASQPGSPFAVDTDDPASALSQIMAAAQSTIVGALVGQNLTARSHSAFGRYDLLLPRDDDTVGVVTHNVASFANSWNVDLDDLLLRTAIKQLTCHAVLCVPHVSTLLAALVEQHAGAFEPDPTALERHLAQVEPTELGDPSQMLSQVNLVFNNLEALLGVASSQQQRTTATQLEGLLALVLAYADFVCDVGGSRLMRSYAAIDEAFARHSVENTAEVDGGALGELLAIEPPGEAVERARAFVAQVADDAGSESLTKMWRSLDLLPKPDELSNPTRWLERYAKSL